VENAGAESISAKLLFSYMSFRRWWINCSVLIVAKRTSLLEEFSSNH
jgi:hypothetical protein